MNSDLWNYKNAFFFAATIVTTVGYGNVYPITIAGKVFTVLYAIIVTVQKSQVALEFKT